MKPDINVLKRIASRVRSEVTPLAGTLKAGEVVGRGAGGDATKLIDKVAEDVVFAELERSSVDCVAVSEECGRRIIGDRLKAEEAYVIVDSVDGTNNAVRGIPFYALSIAAAEGSDLSSIQIALVADLHQGVSYWAVKGAGAASDSTPSLRTSTTSNLKEALVSIDLSAITDEITLQKLMKLILRTSHSRHFGANALELCYLATGKLDVFVDLRGRLRITDMAAAYLIVKEAGGLIVDINGRDLNAPIMDPTEKVSFIASANRALLGQVLGLVRG
ncbi:MAG: inositol monophosphatase family protein [Candidatus Bathyarchaeia archaeon]